MSRTLDPGELVLEVIALHQYGRCLEAMVLLRSVLAPQAALAARDGAERLASVLTASGHRLASPGLPSMRQSALVAEDPARPAAWRLTAPAE